MRLIVSLALVLSINLLSGQNRIAYLSNQSGNFDIFIIDEDGKNQQQLTQNQGWDWAPKWNAHLQAILYNSNDTSNNFSIQAITADGMKKELDTRELEEFLLSPDGNKVLYTLRDKKNSYIGMYDLTQDKNQLLIAHPSYNGRPSWSPTGDQFSFISDRDGNGELYVYDFKKEKPIRLTKSEKREKYTSWSPDGASIYYTYHYSDEKDKEHNDIFKVDVGKKKVTQITNDQQFYQEICVSPDGKKIAFHAKRDGKHHLYLIDTDGSNEIQLTTADAYHGEPEWVPGN